MNRKLQIILSLLILVSCKTEDITVSNSIIENKEFIRAVDISSYPEIQKTNPTFYDLEGNPSQGNCALKSRFEYVFSKRV